MKDIKTALEIFEEACIKHSEATEQGDYKTGNKYYAKIIRVAIFLKSKNAIGNLKDYLSSPFVGVRLWAACYWLAVDEQEGRKVLEEIVKSPGLHSFNSGNDFKRMEERKFEILSKPKPDLKAALSLFEQAATKHVTATKDGDYKTKLDTPLDEVKSGSYFHRELDYLFKRGYIVSPDGLWLVK